MDASGAPFPRRAFLTALAGFGSLGALGWLTLPNSAPSSASSFPWPS
jgi:hypothetical protein